VVRDDVAKTVTLYVNGVEDASSSYAGTVVGLQQTKLLGGATPVGFPGDFFNGLIDEPSIYSRALSAAEIQSIFTAGSAGKPTGSSIGVRVNLNLGTSTGIDGGIANFQNVIGSAGNDILTGSALGGVLVGGAGNDVLTASGGRNILVGGSGVDTLNGGNVGDIFIGGRISYYDEAARTVDTIALDALLAEWSRTDLSYQDRVDHLNGSVPGGLNGPYVLDNTTVFDDGVVDTIFAGPGQNWLLAS
jgi:Ca2+-binding RTX toxin-like protein